MTNEIESTPNLKRIAVKYRIDPDAFVYHFKGWQKYNDLVKAVREATETERDAQELLKLIIEYEC